MNSVIYMLIAFNAVLMIAGVYLVWLRVTSMCCNCCLSCINLAAIITTAVFRFRPMGQLCALSTASVKVESQTQVSPDLCISPYTALSGESVDQVILNGI